MFGKLIRSSNGKFITLTYSIIILKNKKRNYIITHIKHSYFTIWLTYSIDCLGIRFTSNVGNHVKIIQGVVSQIYRFVSIVSFYNTKLSQNTNKGHMCKHQRLHMKYNKSFTSLQYMIVHNGGQVINKPIIFTIP